MATTIDKEPSLAAQAAVGPLPGSLRRYELRCEMLTRLSLARAFEIFERPENLAEITPPWLNFRITTPGPIAMREGAEIEYRIRWLGLPMYWKTLITNYEPPLRFVDEQVAGPYLLWRHLHTFRETPEGVRVADRVEYILPFGPLGRFAHTALVGRQLLGIFRFRQRALDRLFGGDSRTILEPVIVDVR